MKVEIEQIWSCKMDLNQEEACIILDALTAYWHNSSSGAHATEERADKVELMRNVLQKQLDPKNWRE